MTSCTFHPFSRSGWRARGLISVGMQRIELCLGPKCSNAGGAALVRENPPARIDCYLCFGSFTRGPARRHTARSAPRLRTVISVVDR